ncbi:MAG: propanediol utilization protein [Deltaproteobacteria bacterium]|nr:MAG: propanediol utilization protein [Deltaproteobacteria bacterium]RUA01189.1 MAG: propanediol utilization protein [Deltaproteobacteria bacterium]
MDLKAIGMVELNSIAKGVEAGDEMIKAADVDLIMAQPICAGKYMVLVSGDVDSVERAGEVGRETAAEFLVGDFVIPNVHDAVFPALTATTRIQEINSLGVVETFSVASAIMAADAAVKAAGVDIIEIRCATGLGGKSFFYLTGDVSSIESAMDAAIDVLQGTGLILSHVIIPSPSRELTRFIV